ncbi:MAG: hypothetical protein CH104c_0374 [Candidatus Woesebacteria bacterium]|jgi:hypothetical protein|nr:MAG: hypothetical protein CH104c_0374 [Candidatus Woesebacteria bacterium]
MKQKLKHLPHYLGLLGILFLTVLGFWFFSYDRLFQAAVFVSAALSYIVWGVIHHKIHNDLYLQVVIEYVAVALLGLVVVFSLLFS